MPPEVKYPPPPHLLSVWCNPGYNVYGYGYCYLVEMARPEVANITVCCGNEN